MALRHSDHHFKGMKKRKLTPEEFAEIIARHPCAFAKDYPPMESFRFAEEWMEEVESIGWIEMFLEWDRSQLN
jgi:hypothetical protein